MGELRIKKRANGWEYSFECAKIAGKRKSISKGGFRTKTEALVSGTKAKAEYDVAGMVFTPSEMSVSDYMDFWLEAYARTLVDNTYDAYESAVRLHIKPALGSYKLAALNPSVVQHWVNDLKNKGLSETSIKNFRGILSGAMRYAVYPCQYIRTNPCEYTNIPAVPLTEEQRNHKEYICDKEAWRNITDYFNGTPYYLPLMICYHTGMRIGECYGLDLKRDVDFSRHTLSINRQLQKNLQKEWIYKNPKYDSIRTIKIGGTLEALLKSEITVMKMNRLRYGEYYTKTYVDDFLHLHWLPANADVPSGYCEVWPIAKENGDMLTTDHMKYCVRIIKQKLGYTDFHSHCLRHTHGTILAESGASPKTIMERLGHKNIKTTMERYVYNTEKMQDEAVTLFEAAIK